MRNLIRFPLLLIACGLLFFSRASTHAQESHLPYDLAWDDPIDTLIVKLERAGIMLSWTDSGVGGPIRSYWFDGDLKYLGRPVSSVQINVPTKESLRAMLGASFVYLFEQESLHASASLFFDLRATFLEKYGEPDEDTDPGQTTGCLDDAFHSGADLDSAFTACGGEPYMQAWLRIEEHFAYELRITFLDAETVFVTITRFAMGEGSY